MKKLIWIIVAIVIVVGVVFAFKGNSTTTPSISTTTAPVAETGPIKIGFVGPLTGDASSLGAPSKAAVEIAVDEVNSSGGINGRQIQLIAEDGQCNTKVANNAANKLITIDKVSAIIGGLCSSETSSFAPLAMQNKVPVISYCSSAPPLSNTGKYFFRDYPSDSFQGKFAAEYAYNTLGARKVAVLYHVSDYGTGIKEVFEKRFIELGGKIVTEEGTPQDATDYRTQLSKIKASSADYIFAPTFPGGATAMINQYSQMAIKIKLLGSDAWDDTKLQKAVSGKADILYTKPQTPDNAGFLAKLIAKNKELKVTTCVPQAYDAMNIVAGAMKKAGTAPDALSDAIRATKITGVSGNIAFDQNGDVLESNYVVSRIANGASELVK